MFFKRLNERAVILPIMLIMLVFIASYVVILFQSYETNMQIYEQLERQTEKQIQQLSKKE